MAHALLKLPDLPWIQVYYLLAIEFELVFAILFLLNHVPL